MFSNLTAGRKILLVFSGFGAVTLLAGGILALTVNEIARDGRHVGTRLAPLAELSEAIKLSGAQARGRLELIMSGDAPPDFAPVAGELDHAHRLAETILDGGDIDGKALEPSSSPVVRQEIETLVGDIERLEKAARDRFALISAMQGVGSAADAEFDGLYDSLMAEASGVARIHPDDAVVQQAIGELRFLVAHGHLLTEEILSGDLSEDLDEATGAFAAAVEAINAASKQRRAIATSLSPLAGGVKRFSDLAEARFAASSATAAQRQTSERAFDRAFEAFLASAGRAQDEIHRSMVEGLAGLDSSAKRGRLVELVAMTILAAVILAAYRWLDRVLGRRLRDLAELLKRLNGGDLAAEAPAWSSLDEVGQLRDSVEAMRAGLIRQRQLEDEAGRQRREAEAARKVAEAGKAEAEAARTAAESQQAEAEERAREAGRFAAAFGEVVARATTGEFDARIEHVFADPDLIKLADGMNKTMAAVQHGLDAASQAITAMSRGDLTRRMDGSFEGRFAAFQEALNTTLTTLSETVAAIGAVAGSIVADSGGISGSAEGLANRTTSQAAALEETAAAIAQLSDKVSENTAGAERVAAQAGKAAGLAREGERVLADTVAAMEQIDSSAGKVKEIISVIDDISFQTNLLALNAGVEAARAGEAGRGFAVVAQEVRMLAQRATEAAKDIAGLIELSSRDVGAGVKLVEATGGVLKNIAEAIAEVAGTSAEITEAGRQQAAGIAETSATISELDRITQENAAMSETSARAARLLSEQVGRLDERMRFFRNAPSARVRAA